MIKTILLFSLFLVFFALWVGTYTTKPVEHLLTAPESFEPYDMTIEAWTERKGRKKL